MTDRDRSAVRELGKRLADRPAQPVRMTGSTTAGGNDRDTRQDRLPTPIGTEGQVLTVVDVSGDLVPSWEDEAAAVIALLNDIGDVNAPTPSDGDVLTWDSTPGEWVAAAPTGGGAVGSVNGQTGAVVLDADDIDDTTTTNKFATAAELSKLAGIEALADVTDAANVAAAGAVMEADTSTAAMSFVIDEDSFASDSATKVPTQQSVKAYVDAQVAGGGYTDEQVRDTVGTTLVAGDGIAIAVDDPGDTITISATEAATNPLLTKRMSQVLKNPGNGTTITQVGYSGVALTGTLAGADDADGPWCSCTTSTTLNNVAGHNGGSGSGEVRRDWEPDSLYVIKTDPSSITDTFLVVGTASSTPTPASILISHVALFRYDTSTDGTAFWRAVTNNAGTPTVTDTGVAIAANTMYVLRIVMGASNVLFYIDGTLVATHTTTLPTATQQMVHYGARIVNIVGGAGTARAVKFGRLACAHAP